LIRPIDDRYGTYRGLIRLWLAKAELAARRLRPFTTVQLERVRRVVFVCQGNICRSCFAEAQAHALGLNAASFGLATAGNAPAFPVAVATAKNFGVDLEAHRTTDLEDFQFLEGDLVLAMEIRQARSLRLLIKQQHMQVSLLGLWAKPSRPHIHDPHGLSVAYFHSCFDVIRDSVRNLAPRLEGARNVGSRATAGGRAEPQKAV
jgi:protein-tyrosine phosphatase